MVIGLLWLFLTLFLFIVENHWFLFFPGSQSPDLLLLLLVVYALDQGARRGTFYGLGAGLLLDIVTFSYFGWHTITRGCIGLLVGHNRQNMFADRLVTYEILVGMLTLLLQVARGLFLCLALGRWLPFFPLAFLTLKTLFWNLVAGPVVWVAYRKMKPKVQRRLDYYYHVE